MKPLERSEVAEVLDRLQRIEDLLDRLCNTQAQPEEWVNSERFCQLVGIPPGQLSYYLKKGVPSGVKAVANVGTPGRPRYRFHQKRAVAQFLNRAANSAR